MLKKLNCVICALLLSGFWDERLYKNIAVVPIVAHEGKIGELTSYYSVPIIKEGVPKSFVIDGKGVSPRDTRMDADLKTSQNIDISKLSVLLFSDEIAKSDIYEYLDEYYRNARNQLSTYLAITEGSPKAYLELGNEIQEDSGSYFKEYIKSLSFSSIYPETDLQMICTFLFDDGIDVTIPYFKLAKNGTSADFKGVALFNGHEYTGDYLSKQEAIMLSVLRDNIGKNARFSYLFRDSPATVNILGIKKKWDLSEIEKSQVLKLFYKITVDVQEFPKDHLNEKKNRLELEKFLSDKLQEEAEKVFKILQESKSDPLGIGRSVRAFHPKLWGKGDWNDTFSELSIETNIEVEIKTTGILH